MAFQQRWNNNSSRFVSRHERIQEFSSGGGSRSICHKNPWQHVFLVLFLVGLHLFYRMPMVYFKENYNFPRFQRGFNIFSRGGVQLFLGGGGSNCLFPIEAHITCVFPVGSGPLAPPPPSGSVHAIFCCEKKLVMRKSYQFWPPPSPGYS